MICDWRKRKKRERLERWRRKHWKNYVGQDGPELVFRGVKRWLITVCECGELWWAITPKDCCSADKKTIEFIDAADLERRAASAGKESEE